MYGKLNIALLLTCAAVSIQYEQMPSDVLQKLHGPLYQMARALTKSEGHGEKIAPPPSVVKNKHVLPYLLNTSRKLTADNTSLQSVATGPKLKESTTENNPQHLKYPLTNLNKEVTNVNTIHSTKGSDVGESTKINTSIIICNLCPLPEEILPCKCECLSGTSAKVMCGPELLSCNELTDILTMASFPVTQYERLEISGTSLECVLEARLWGGAVTFRKLYLNDNHFDTVDNNAFKPFWNTLKLLNLNTNSLVSMYFPTISNLHLLEYLFLSHNQLSFLPGSSSMVLASLKRLMLSHNLLTSLQGNTFAELPALECIDLSFNQISELPNDALRITNHSAQRLVANISNNAIAGIRCDAFAGVPTTADVTIDLKYNMLDTLPETAFIPLLTTPRDSPLKILLSGNPLVCDKRLCWLVNKPAFTQHFDDFPCTNLNAALTDLNPVMLSCEI